MKKNKSNFKLKFFENSIFDEHPSGPVQKFISIPKWYKPAKELESQRIAPLSIKSFLEIKVFFKIIFSGEYARSVKALPDLNGQIASLQNQIDKREAEAQLKREQKALADMENECASLKGRLKAANAHINRLKRERDGVRGEQGADIRIMQQEN